VQRAEQHRKLPRTNQRGIAKLESRSVWPAQRIDAQTLSTLSHGMGSRDLNFSSK